MEDNQMFVMPKLTNKRLLKLNFIPSIFIWHKCLFLAINDFLEHDLNTSPSFLRGGNDLLLGQLEAPEASISQLISEGKTAIALVIIVRGSSSRI